METGLHHGSMFIMDGLLLPPALRFEGKPYCDGWRLVRGLNSQEIDTCARDCGWNLISIGSGMKRSALGFGRAWSLRRATDRLLVEARKNAFNAMEITHVNARQFLGLHLVSVSAHSRSLQKGGRVKDLSARRRDYSG